MAAPIHNSMHSISGMYPGRMIKVKGCVPPCAKRFNINLQYTPNLHFYPDPQEDIALHLAIFPERHIARNTFTANKWGVEEKDGCLPMKKGDQFEVSISCEPCGFQVALNGAHFCEYRHRIPFQKILYLTVEGDVMVQLIKIEGAQPGGCGGPQGPVYTATYDMCSTAETCG